MEIKAVILDFGGTLADGGLEWDEYHQALQAYLSSLGYDVEMRDLKKALRSALGELNRIRARGKEQTFEEVYANFLRKLGVPDDAETLDALHQNFRDHYKTQYYPCIEDVLRQLSARYRVALLSNTMSDQPHHLLEKAGYTKFFDLRICSRDLGIRKPNPEIFRHVLGELGVEPHEAVHVGDSVEADMEGAAAAGITGVWIKTPGQPPWTGHAIGSICELPAYLKKMEASG